MKSYSHVPKALFDVDLDLVTLACLKGRITDPQGELAARLRQMPQLLSDALMFAPRLTFKVTHENAPLAILVGIFGAKAVEELLRSGDIDFILWRDEVAVTRGVPYAIPFVGLTLNTPAEWCDPEASNAAGLGQVTGLTESQRKRLTQLATDRTSVTKPEKPKLIIQALEEAHKAGDLSLQGFPPSVSLTTATDRQKAELVKPLAQLQMASELVERELDLHESALAWDTMLNLSAQVISSPQVLRTAEALMREERVPSVGRLLARKALSPSDVVKLRQTSEAQAFREWLWTRPDPANSEDVLREYRRVIAKDRKDLKGKWWYRTLRVLGVEGVVTLAEQAFPGVNPAATIGVRMVVPIADELLRLAREKRSPRRLARLVRDEATSSS